MQKGDELEVVVVEIKLVLAEQFSNLTLTKSPPREITSKFTACTSYLQPSSSGDYL